jgi:tRNA threonylcarbamoyl adenosine modification protein (Sua5/YciO/YrdC/YwlC family)
MNMAEAIFIRINSENPQEKFIKQVVDCLKNGGVVIYPTDTVYGIGCDIHNSRAVERICKIKGIKPNKSNFSFVCNDLSHISEYTKNISTSVFKMMKKVFPGPYTIILESSNKVPKLLYNSKITVGIRVPNNPICKRLVEDLGNPILSSSVKQEDDDILEYITDPEDIFEKYKHLVDIVIDGGCSGIEGSTVVDASDGDIVIIREGAGEINF